MKNQGTRKIVKNKKEYQKGGTKKFLPYKPNITK